MRKLLLLITALTLTFAPSALASTGTPLQVLYPTAPDLKFGTTVFTGNVATVELTATNSSKEITLGPTSVVLELAGWTAQPVAGLAADGRTLQVPQLEGGKSVVFPLTLTPPAGTKPATSVKIKATSGASAADATIVVPGLALVPLKFKKIKRLGFNGLRFEANVTIKAAAPEACTTKALKPSATVFAQSKKGKPKKVAAGDLAKGTLKSKGGVCRLAFEYYFDHKYDGKLGSFTFKFKPTVGGKKLKVDPIQASVAATGETTRKIG